MSLNIEIEKKFEPMLKKIIHRKIKENEQIYEKII
jgi:hypothetical protein